MNHAMAVFASRQASVIAIAVMLSSCTTQIQMTCTVPSRVGLQKGASLEIQAEDSTTSKAIQATLSQELQQGLFYSLSANADYQLRISETREYTWSKGGSSEDEFLQDNETELTTRITLSSKSDSVYGYSQKYNVTAEEYSDTVEAICHDIARDLQPHRIIYTEKLNAPAGNPAFEQAADYCRAGMWQHAARAAEQAVKLTPHEPEAYYLQGLIHRQLENYDTANTCFHQARQQKADTRYTEAACTTRMMQNGARYARQQLRMSSGSEFDKKTLPAYHKKEGTPWTHLFFHL